MSKAKRIAESKGVMPCDHDWMPYLYNDLETADSFRNPNARKLVKVYCHRCGSVEKVDDDR